MEVAEKGLNQFIKQYYGNKSEHFKDELNAIIFYLHYVDSEAINTDEIRESCLLLRSLIKAID